MKKSLSVRPLRLQEARSWVEIAAPPDDVESRLKRFTEHLEAATEDERCYLVAAKDGDIVGTLGGALVHANQYLIESVRVRHEEDFGHVGRALLSWLGDSFACQIKAMVRELPEFQDYQHLLETSGFDLYMRKPYVKRNLIGYTNPHPVPFTFRSLSELGTTGFAQALAEACGGSLSRDVLTTDPVTDLEESIAEAGSAFDPKAWTAAYLDGRLAGVCLPQRYPDVPRQGTMLNIGIVPEFRGQGLGRTLHAAGLELLARQGVEEYIGSTDADNSHMLKVFDANGCRITGVWRLYRLTDRP